MFFVLDGLEQHLYFFENEKVEYAVCFHVLGDFRSLGFMKHFSAAEKICHILLIAMRKRGSFNLNGN